MTPDDHAVLVDAAHAGLALVSAVRGGDHAATASIIFELATDPSLASHALCTLAQLSASLVDAWAESEGKSADDIWQHAAMFASRYWTESS